MEKVKHYQKYKVSADHEKITQSRLAVKAAYNNMHPKEQIAVNAAGEPFTKIRGISDDGMIELMGKLGMWMLNNHYQSEV